MTDLALVLDDYPALSPADRAAADARLAERPDLAQAWAEARRLAAVFAAAAAAPGADDLARAAVDRRMGRVTPEAAALDAARAADPALDAEAERVEVRLRALEDGMADPVAAFEARTGLALPPRPVPAADPAPPRPLSGPPAGPLTLVGPAPTRRRRWAPRLAAAAAVVLVAYGGLWAASSASVTPREQMAELGAVRAEAGFDVRSGGQATASQALDAALEAVGDARRSTLGLFPAYDAAALDAAAVDLAAVAETAAPDSWVSQEARLALGRVLVHRSRDADAARVLGDLVAEGSYRASAARRLLDFVRAQ